MTLRWTKHPRGIATTITTKANNVRRGTSEVASSVAAEAEERMKRDAPWQDRTGEARAGLYAEVTKTGDVSQVELGTRAPHGPFLELGTSRMAPRPIIGPTMDAMATEAVEELGNVVRREFGG